MLLPSYKLYKNGDGVWICTGEMPESKRPFRFEAGEGTRDRAEGIVEGRLRAKAASSRGSRARWERWKAEQAAKNSAAPPAPAPSPPAVPPAPAPRPVDEVLRAKLLKLGDSQPIDPDAVIPPADDGQPADAGAETAADDDDQADEIDTEGAELIASLLAKGATVGLVGLVNRQLRKRRPPMEAEPHEKGLEWFHDGMEHHLTTLLGRTATLGPTGKIFAGAAIILGSMYINAEPIAGAQAAPPAPAPAPPPVQHDHPTNGAAAETALARPGPVGIPLGTFGVEKSVAN